MSTDRELLEAAARAAGIDVLWPVMKPGAVPVAMLDSSIANTEPTYWSPLTDDGDALRLAVKLGIEIGNFHQYGRALAYHGATWGAGEFWELGEPCSATRRAIVRAAAAIGASGTPERS